ncbi:MULTISPECIES: hypothetical protein [Arcobacteraceae]|uniref:Uncharacterized protein n=1 Tax=Arcobacter lacus TaxID=1912876 RepID=A0ABX5JJD3_9BACT|nr:hypothetical protein [Arcobacter lacus]PUE66239.1 hypothetical protein B0175_05895 [Arcobacter lacus]
MYIKKITAFIIALFTLLSGVIAVYLFSDQKYSEIFGSDDNNIQIINMKLIPSMHFLNKEFDFYGNTNIAITAKNFGNTKIHITSYTLNINSNKKLEAKSYAKGERILDTDPKESSSIFIEPGEEKTFYLSKSLSLKDVIPFFYTDKFKNSIYSNLNNGNYLLHNIEINDYFNYELKKIYQNSEIEIQLFTGYKKLIKEHKVKLSDGITIFDNNGKFQHDTFLAKVFAIQTNDYNYILQFK